MRSALPQVTARGVLLWAALAGAAAAQPVPTDTAVGLPRGTPAVQSATFTTQEPADPGVFDAPATASLGCTIPLNPLEVMWREPAGGVTSSTGLLVVLRGISTSNDCARSFFLHDTMWPETKDVVAVQVFYRNLAFFAPYDFGKYQMIDVLRGVDEVLSRYPQIDRRRLYILGGSGGGHVTLQLLQATRHIWADVQTHAAITRITTATDVAGLYEEDPGPGWNTNLQFPVTQGALDNDTWARYQAERDLRGPQHHAALDAPWAPAVADNAPPLTMMHGTADPTVDVQHVRDYLAAVEGFAGMEAAQASATRWELGTLTVVEIPGGDHSYAGAAPDEDTVGEAVAKHTPSAFTRVRPTVPTLAINYAFPARHGWRYRLTGTTLGNVTLATETVPSSVGDWMMY